MISILSQNSKYDEESSFITSLWLVPFSAALVAWVVKLSMAYGPFLSWGGSWAFIGEVGIFLFLVAGGVLGPAILLTLLFFWEV